MKTKIIAIANGKGGVAKTASTRAIAAILTKYHNYKVLVIDMDHQANLTRQSGVKSSKAINSALRGETKVSEHIVETPNYDLVPAAKELSALDRQFVDTVGREQKLKEAISQDKELKKYDFILIDTCPDIDLAAVSSLVAANFVLIPATPSEGAVLGMDSTAEQLPVIRQYCGAKTKILGIFLADFNPRLNAGKLAQGLIQKMIESVTASGKGSKAGKKELTGAKIFNTYIRHSVVVEEANLLHKNLIDYKPNSPVAQDYVALTEEILKEVI